MIMTTSPKEGAEQRRLQQHRALQLARKTGKRSDSERAGTESTGHAPSDAATEYDGSGL